MLQKNGHTHIECLKCAHENGCTLGYLGNVRLLSGTSEHVRFEHVRPFGTHEKFPIKKKIGKFW